MWHSPSLIMLVCTNYIKFDMKHKRVVLPGAVKVTVGVIVKGLG